MSFIRKKTVKGRTYYQVEERYWEEGRVRSRVVAYLGTQPTAEQAYRESEAHYFALRKGRSRDPWFTKIEMRAWVRLAKLKAFLQKANPNFKITKRHEREIWKWVLWRRETRKEEREREYREWWETFTKKDRASKESACAMLGLPSDATPDQVKAAYRRMALMHHPDRGGDTETMTEINEAYETLTE